MKHCISIELIVDSPSSEAEMISFYKEIITSYEGAMHKTNWSCVHPTFCPHCGIRQTTSNVDCIYHQKPI